MGNIGGVGEYSKLKIWNPLTLAWESMTQPLISTDTLTVSGTTDLTKIGGVAVGAGNGLYIRPGTSVTFSTKTGLTPQAPTQVSVDLISEELVAANTTRTGMHIKYRWMTLCLRSRRNLGL